jgi:(2R)-sulfolactate sulfo-lyase subunit alpha
MKKKENYQFLVHDEKDNVGVAVVGINAGDRIAGLVMDTQKNIELKSLMGIPFGHKIALRDLRSGGTIIKYGHDVGRAVANIRKGEHVHIHNVKTKRW